MPPPCDARTAATNRNASPKNSVPQPGPSGWPSAWIVPGSAARRQERPGVEGDRAPPQDPDERARRDRPRGRPRRRAGVVGQRPFERAAAPRTRRGRRRSTAGPGRRSSSGPQRQAQARTAGSLGSVLIVHPSLRRRRPGRRVTGGRPPASLRPGEAAAPGSADLAVRPASIASGSSSAWLNPSRSASRPSGPGAHQFQRPISRIAAGTSRTRMTVASMNDRDRHPDADALDRDRLGQGEGREDDDHDQGRAGDHAGRPATALRRPMPGCRRSGGRPPGSATGAGPRSPSTARTGC